MSNSPLVNYTRISPNRSSRKGNKISKITIHHMAGNLSVETCGNVFAPSSRQASSNYGIGSDGRVGMYVEEHERAWTSSNGNNDRKAVTIEVANNQLAPNWTVSDAAWNKLIELCVDICRRNGIDKLVWTGDANGNLTTHDMFANTNCPGPYLKPRMGDIANYVNNILSGNSNSAPQPQPQPNPQPADSGNFGGTYRCTVNELRVRTGPGLSYAQVTDSNGRPVYYNKGNTVNLDNWYKIADGWVWGRYTGYSGNVRYIAVGKATGKPEPDDYLVKI